MNTEQLKKIEEILNKLAYNCLNYEKEGNNYMVSDALKDLLPHLISSQTAKSEEMSKDVLKVEEIKREAYKKALDDMFLTIAELAEPDERQPSAGDLRTNLDDIHEIRNSLNKKFITQSKEGGE